MSVIELTVPSSQIIRPDYQGGSIVNLMSSIGAARGYQSPIYPFLTHRELDRLRDFTNIVLLIIDGLGYNYVVDRGAGNVLCEHLKGRMTSVFPPTTATAIPTFLTGYPPQQHGLAGWFTYLEEFHAVVAVLPFVKRGSNDPLEADGIGLRQLTNQPSIFERLAAQCHTVMPRDIAYSRFNIAFSSQATIHPYITLNQMLTTIIRLLREGTEPKFIHAYWPELDRLAHKYGIASSQVMRHFELIDAELTRFKRSLPGTDTIVIATADHGFIDADAAQVIHLENHPILSETLMMPLSGEPRLAYCYVYPDKREQFEAYINSELSDRVALYRSQDLISNHFYGLGDCHPRFPDRVGHYVLIAKGRTTIRDRVAGERPPRDIGVHGGASEEEMYVPFVVMTG